MVDGYSSFYILIMVFDWLEFIKVWYFACKEEEKWEEYDKRRRQVLSILLYIEQ